MRQSKAVPAIGALRLFVPADQPEHEANVDMIRSPHYRLLLAAALLSAGACQKGDAASDDTAALSASTQQTAVNHANTVPVAERPANPCGWISEQEVTSIIGPLAGPPTAYEGACRYTLPIPQSVLDERAQQMKALEMISKMPGASPMKPKEYDPYAIDLRVTVDGDVAAERTANATFAILKKMADDSSTDTLDTRRNKNGWDVQKTHGGRIGHVDVDVTLVSLEVKLPRDKLDTLAVHTRDHIRDLPFAMPADYSAGESRDPCVLLTRQEAEAVLGPLVVAPYRSANDGPLAYPNGTSCSYFTRGHHVLIVTPHWDNGKFSLQTMRGVQGLMGKVMDNASDQSADTIEGPWDQAAIDLDGRLALLKGDRLLEIQYLMSTTDEAGALKLARPALDRLANAH